MKKSKYDRILSLYSMLNTGEVIKKSDIATEFGVTERTIQRDIDDIRAFYYDNTLDIGCGKTIVFDRKAQGYKLVDSQKELLTNSEILAVCKILLESRSLVKSEMMPIIEKLLQRCVPENNKKAVKDLIGNEMFHYVEPRHGKSFVDKLWDIGVAIQKNKVIKITYSKLKGDVVNRTIEPVGIMVSEYYFYLIGFVKNLDKKENFHNPNDLYPTIYRIDRIESLIISEEHFTPAYSNRFQEGEFRKRVQFMFGGHLQKIKLKYRGLSVESVLDKIPTAEILSKDETGYIIQAETFGSGIEMWIKSQGEYIELIDRIQF